MAHIMYRERKMNRMDDLISRQAAIDALKEHRALYCDNTPNTFSILSYAEKSRVDELDTAIAILVNLPSAERHGKWTTERTIEHDGEIYCEQCGWTWENLTFDRTKVKKSPYCPNCGASMMDEVGE